MSELLEEPPLDPLRGHFSQLCVLFTGIATGVVDPPAAEAGFPLAYHMGLRDGYHVVVAHLASSATLREAAEKCEAFGEGVDERAGAHPYGPAWCEGFVRATFDAAADIAMYAATNTLPHLDRARLRAARTAARYLAPQADGWSVLPRRRADDPPPPAGSREW